MTSIDTLENDIKNLKVQGATNIALAVLDGLNLASENIKIDKSLVPHIYLLEQCLRLAFIRPTEPLAQNALRYIFQKKELEPQTYLSLAKEYKKMIIDSKAQMAGFGSELVKDGGIYLTHCHSSTVTSMFINAHKIGKRFQIFVTETRPMYQGRITVKELLNAGLNNITMVVDDIATSILLESQIKFDGVFIGADLLSQSGFMNKIGSLGIAFCAQKQRIPVFTMSVLLKYDPRKYTAELVEKRDGFEIWSEAPEGLKFYYPAFDFIPYYDNISLVTETGIIKCQDIKSKAFNLYPFLKSEISPPPPVK